MKNLFIVILVIAVMFRFLPQFHHVFSDEMHVNHGQMMTHTNTAPENPSGCHDKDCIKIVIDQKLLSDLITQDWFPLLFLSTILFYLFQLRRLLFHLKRNFSIPYHLEAVHSTVFLE